MKSGPSLLTEPYRKHEQSKMGDRTKFLAIVQAATTVSRPPEPTLEQNNRWFHQLLTDGIPVEYRTPDGETRGDKAKLLDCRGLSANDFLVVGQLTIKNGESTRRPDLVAFLNGLPVAVIELKDPSNQDIRY
jgi:type I restriction enzyme, R subunit